MGSNEGLCRRCGEIEPHGMDCGCPGDPCYGLHPDHIADTNKKVQPAPASLPEEVRHTDDIAVDEFASAMKAKLALKRADGRGGWDNPEECHLEFLVSLLHGHIQKGDPVDVGNIAMMLWNRGVRGNSDVLHSTQASRLAEADRRRAAIPEDFAGEVGKHKGREFWKCGICGVQRPDCVNPVLDEECGDACPEHYEAGEVQNAR